MKRFIVTLCAVAIGLFASNAFSGAERAAEQGAAPSAEAVDPAGAKIKAKDPTGKAKDPTGKAKDPTGKAKDPTGKAKDPTGKAKDPTGKAKDPTGKAKDPTGKAKDPTGKAKDPTGKAKDPTGKAKDPTGKAKDPTGKAKDPTGKAKDPTGKAKDPMAKGADSKAEGVERKGKGEGGFAPDSGGPDGRFVSRGTFAKIKPGASSEQVKAMLGEPASKTSAENGNEVWSWSYAEVPNNNGGILQLLNETAPGGTAQNFDVEFKDGKVVGSSQ